MAFLSGNRVLAIGDSITYDIITPYKARAMASVRTESAARMAAT